MTFLELNSLAKNYGNVAALDGVSLSVAAGSRTAIVGPSGCGKTTLLRLVAGFDQPDAGKVVLDGRVLAGGSFEVPAHKRGIGIVAQDGCLFPHLTVAQNIGFGMTEDRAAREAKAAELMEMVGLDRSMLSRKPDQLSGGQQQRVALARALARKPRLMLLDEPFSALDTGLRAATRKAVTDVLAAAGITTLLVTHDQGEALAFADQVAVMRGGRFVQVGSPRDVYLRPVDAVTAAFLGEAIVLPASVSDGRMSCAFGDAPVSDSAYRGEARVMLRPEQLSLDYDDREAGGLISAVDFRGPTSGVTLTFPEDVSITLDMPSSDELLVGRRVTVVLSGTAHILR